MSYREKKEPLNNLFKISEMGVRMSFLDNKCSDIYEILRKKLKIPSSLSQLLRETLSETEVQILSFFCEKYLDPENLSVQLKISLESIKEMLESLYKRGFVKKKAINGHTLYKTRSFYHVVRICLEEGRYEEFDLGLSSRFKKLLHNDKNRKNRKGNQGWGFKVFLKGNSDK
jgi:predicted transcriptional regulator